MRRCVSNEMTDYAALIRATLLRLQLTDDGSSLCCIDLIESGAGKARHERGRRPHLLSVAAGKSLIEKILTGRSHLWRTDTEIVGLSALNFYFAFIIHRDRIHAGDAVLSRRFF